MTTKELYQLAEDKISLLQSPYSISFTDFERLSAEDKELLHKYIAAKLKDLKGKERDAFLLRVNKIIDFNTKDDIWEDNHKTIMHWVKKIMINENRAPTQMELVSYTRLSRSTIIKHLKEYKDHPMYQWERELMKISMETVIERLGIAAMKGNVQAIKLYLHVSRKHFSTNTSNPNKAYEDFYYFICNSISIDAFRKLSEEQRDKVNELIIELAHEQRA
jgi:hypothetical protein